MTEATFFLIVAFNLLGSLGFPMILLSPAYAMPHSHCALVSIEFYPSSFLSWIPCPNEV